MTQIVKIFYQTKSGKHVLKAMPYKVLPLELKKLHRRQIETVAKFGGYEVGWVWKLDGKWTWCYEYGAEDQKQAV